MITSDVLTVNVTKVGEGKVNPLGIVVLEELWQDVEISIKLNNHKYANVYVDGINV